MVAHRGYATQNVANPTPPQAHRFWDSAMTRDLLGPRALDVLCPFEKIVVTPSTHARKESKFQMIMSIDEPGKQQVTLEINAGARHLGRFSFLLAQYGFNAAPQNAHL